MMWARKREYTSLSTEQQQEYRQKFIAGLRKSPIAMVPQKANEQHYEVRNDVPFNFHIRLCCAGAERVLSIVFGQAAQVLVLLLP